MNPRFLSRTDVFYLVIAYMELMAMCAFSDELLRGWSAMFEAVHGSILFYFINYFLLFAVLACALNGKVGDKTFCTGRCVAWGMSAVFMGFVAAKRPEAMGMPGLSSFFFLLVFFLEIKVWVNDRRKEKRASNSSDGFITDYFEKEKLLNVGWERYAESLAVRLVSTDTSHAAFAVALTGRWGAGKTTFLGYLKDALGKEGCSYMEFNPWLGYTPKGIVMDFFKALKSKLRQRGLYLDGEIDRYAKSLLKTAELSLTSKLSLSVGMGNREENDLFTLHKKLSDALQKLDGNLFVLIDDIDRLQQEEIFEVLRLVRNTADFNHIVYVVTCDKGYVTDTLGNMGLAKPEEYLKKIFQLELKFPMFEGYLFTELLNKSLEEHTHYEDSLKQEFNLLEPRVTQRGIVMGDYLENFREAKRLANSFVLNVDYIDRQKVKTDFDIVDLFLLHLLEFTDEKAYGLLRTNTWDLLCLDSSDNKIIHLKNDKELEKNGYTFCNRTKKLLEALFKKDENGTGKPKRNSIRRQDHIYNYFSFRPYAYQMSLTDFVDLMKNASEETIREYVKNSSVGIFSKKESIYAMMKEQWLERLDGKTVNNFLTLLMAWTQRYQDDDKPEKIGDLYRDVLDKSRINAKHVEMVKEKLTPFLKSLKDPDHGFRLQQKIYAKMVPCFVEYKGEGEEEYFPDCIYENNELRELMKENTRQFLQAVNPSAKQLLESSRLYEFIRCSKAYNEAYTPNVQPQFDCFPQEVADEMIAFFSTSKEDNDLHFFTSKFELDNYQAEADSSQEKEMKKNIADYFADVKFYKRFIQECCNGGEEEKEKYFRRNKL